MNGRSLYWFVRYLVSNFTADGMRRVVCAVVNVFLVGAACGCVYGIVTLADGMGLGVVLSLICIVVLVVVACYLVVNGVVGQLVLLVMSAVGCFADAEHRASAVAAFAIALLSFAAAGVGLWLLLR